jgi:hypothetical protein
VPPRGAFVHDVSAGGIVLLETGEKTTVSVHALQMADGSVKGDVHLQAGQISFDEHVNLPAGTRSACTYFLVLCFLAACRTYETSFGWVFGVTLLLVMGAIETLRWLRPKRPFRRTYWAEYDRFQLVTRTPPKYVLRFTRKGRKKPLAIEIIDLDLAPEQIPELESFLVRVRPVGSEPAQSSSAT